MRKFTTGLALLAFAAGAFASPVFTATGTASCGDSEDAQAAFVFGTGTLQVQLTNLNDEIHSACSAISDLSFSLADSNGNTITGGTEGLFSGQEITVNSTATGADGGWSFGNTLTDDPWAFTAGTATTLYTLEGLGAGSNGPEDTLIGPPVGGLYVSTAAYSDANASIFTDSHNPHLGGTIVFSFAIPGVDSSTQVSSAIFSFGTDAGVTLDGTCTGDCGGGGGGLELTPEPSSVVLGGIGLLGLLLLKRRYSHS
ncbi:MAG TPA: PEP-CTERM sorting domain-containing protein [Bryobacteraceae bacterium]|nr:PEP-CTERM sorting domain-containing protein [Bryobacteraceae bacterium]